MKQTFATKLREQREAAGLSQSELAGRAGLHTQAVAKIEQGIREPSLATAQAIARALGLSLSAFDDVILGTEQTAQPRSEKEPARPRGRPKKVEAPASSKASGEKAKKPRKGG
jgi:transcriptional regulator with XRE-family HTH domain